MLTFIGGLFLVWLVFALLFSPHIPYHLERDLDATSDHFVNVLESTCLVKLEPGNIVDVFTNGDRFYPAMLEALSAATETVHMECYIFKKGEIGERFIEALAERGRAGVRVTLVLDAIGSFGTLRTYAKRLRDAGCRVEAYQKVTWYRLSRLNNRTHRELLVIDGSVAFVGGAGIADWWYKPLHGKPMWRDMMARIEGPVVPAVQGIASENWIEVCGEILTGPEIYKRNAATGTVAAFALKSSPSDRSTVSRVLFQTLIEGANYRVRVSTPYFLPDKAFRQALVRTMERGVSIEVMVPGPRTDQRWVRLASRRLYGELLEAGVRIFEYEPGMTHVKTLIVDDLWSAIGTTNLDNRSFEHNDEMNVAIRDVDVSSRLTTDFLTDVANSQEITLELWKRRPFFERLLGPVAWILERQQ